MSRHNVTAFNTQPFTVIVGWDNPLQTYFAQVWDSQLKDEDDGGCVFWVGTHPGSVRTAQDLAQVVSGYAVLPEDLVTQLEQDQAESEPPSPLQQWVSARLKPESICDEQENPTVNPMHEHHCYACGITLECGLMRSLKCGCDRPFETLYCNDCEPPF